MNQGNHWPLGSRLMTPEEASAEINKATRTLDAFSMAPSNIPSAGAYAKLSNELQSTKDEKTQRVSRPINWLGRP